LFAISTRKITKLTIYQILPEAVSVPFLQVATHLGLPPTATYAALNLWNWKLRSKEASVCSPDNLDALHTFTGTRDEEWFLLVSVAMEARCAAIIPVMLRAISASRENNSEVVKESLEAFAQCAVDLGILLERMYEQCDPYVFYYEIRPFLAGSKNNELVGLPRGVFYDEGDGNGQWRQYSGGSNAQSSLIQFLDAVLSIEHEATGALKEKKGKGGYLMVRNSHWAGFKSSNKPIGYEKIHASTSRSFP
jgi:indoleamine 2,3-dioxygenase